MVPKAQHLDDQRRYTFPPPLLTFHSPLFSLSHFLFGVGPFAHSEREKGECTVLYAIFTLFSLLLLFPDAAVEVEPIDKQNGHTDGRTGHRKRQTAGDYPHPHLCKDNATQSAYRTHMENRSTGKKDEPDRPMHQDQEQRGSTHRKH